MCMGETSERERRTCSLSTRPRYLRRAAFPVYPKASELYRSGGMDVGGWSGLSTSVGSGLGEAEEVFRLLLPPAEVEVEDCAAALLESVGEALGFAGEGWMARGWLWGDEATPGGDRRAVDADEGLGVDDGTVTPA